MPRLDGPFAQQDLAFGLDHAARDDARVFVVDGAAVGAYEAGQMVARRDAEADRVATVGAELHEVTNCTAWNLRLGWARTRHGPLSLRSVQLWLKSVKVRIASGGSVRAGARKRASGGSRVHLLRVGDVSSRTAARGLRTGTAVARGGGARQRAARLQLPFLQLQAQPQSDPSAGSSSWSHARSATVTFRRRRECPSVFRQLCGTGMGPQQQGSSWTCGEERNALRPCPVPEEARTLPTTQTTDAS